jgi:hypothetical protein
MHKVVPGLGSGKMKMGRKFMISKNTFIPLLEGVKG